jgi:hypothetical protein
MNKNTFELFCYKIYYQQCINIQASDICKIAKNAFLKYVHFIQYHLPLFFQ